MIENDLLSLVTQLMASYSDSPHFNVIGLTIISIAMKNKLSSEKVTLIICFKKGRNQMKIQQKYYYFVNQIIPQISEYIFLFQYKLCHEFNSVYKPIIEN